MYRVLALDLDGTLLNSQRVISPYTCEVLQRAVEAGIQLVIVTGQTLQAMRQLCSALTLCGPHILYNGALVIDIESEEVYYEQYLPPALLISALEETARLGLFRVYHTREQVYVDVNTPGAHRWYLPPLTPAIEIADMFSLRHHPCIKLAGVGNIQDVREKREHLARHFAGQLYVTQSSRTLLELLHPEVSKGQALAQLAQRLGIGREEIVAVGDNHNDIGMLRFAGLGIAMGNAHEEVKEAADEVTLRNDEEGVAVAIEKWVLG